jgi:predicted phage terminase large subunit-like protein
MPGVVAIKPQRGKLARLHAVLPEWQARDWYLSRNAAWTEAFVEQLIMFPNGRNDDMVDMMTQAAAWLLQTPTRHITVWPTAWSGPVRQFYE